MGVRGMSKLIRVRCEKGVLKPLDKIDVTEGEELEVLIIRRRFSGFSEKLSGRVIKVDSDVVEEFCSERR